MDCQIKPAAPAERKNLQGAATIGTTKGWKLLILMLLCGLLLGCFNLEQRVKINSDGSGIVSVTVTPGETVPISAFKDQRFLEVTKSEVCSTGYLLELSTEEAS